MITMDAATHRALSRYAGAWLEASAHRGINVAEHGQITGSSAVYIACDALERVLYVGSVHRPGQHQGFSNRIAEHLREARKFQSWRRLWVLRLKTGVSLTIVRDIEAVVGAELDPQWNDRLPRMLP